MDRFLEMQSFNTVVEAGSFVSAADALNLSKAAVSRHVVELENRLGIRLLHRTTRRVSLTPEGQVFYGRSKELLAELADAEARADRDGLRIQTGVARADALLARRLHHHIPAALERAFEKGRQSPVERLSREMIEPDFHHCPVMMTKE